MTDTSGELKCYDWFFCTKELKKEKIAGKIKF